MKTKLRTDLMIHVGGSFIEHACYHQLTPEEIDLCLYDLLVSHLQETGRLKSWQKKKKKEKKKEKKILQFPEVWNG